MGNRILCVRKPRGQNQSSADIIPETYPIHGLSNAAEIIDLLNAPPPAGEPLCRYSYYSGKSNVAMYITATLDSVACIQVLGDVTRSQADEINSKLGLCERLLPEQFQDVAEAVLGESVNPEHPKGSYLARWHLLI